MSIIEEDKDPAFFDFISKGNLLRQFDYLHHAVEIALKTGDFPVTHELILTLNKHVVEFLCETPGIYRRNDVSIKNCDHDPPTSREIKKLMDQYLLYLKENWESPALHLSAYALWRLNWIHPFQEGNGRTARAVSYLILCVKNKMWLPGSNTIPTQIRADRTPYYAALRVADKKWKEDGEIDVSEMEIYLERLLKHQLTGQP